MTKTFIHLHLKDFFRFIILFLFLSCAQSSLKAQELDSTLSIFFNDEFGKTPIIKENGSTITVWVGKNNIIYSGNLRILSDSTIAVGVDTIFLSQINATTNAKKNRVAGGFIAILGGAATSGLGFGFVAVLNKAVDGNIGLLLLALPAYVVAASMIAGGAIIAGVGVVTAVSGAPRKVKLKIPAKVKYKFYVALSEDSTGPSALI